MIGCEFCIRDPEGPSEFCAACLIEQREHFRAALTAILNEFDPGENDPVARLAREALEAGER